MNYRECYYYYSYYFYCIYCFSSGPLPAPVGGLSTNGAGAFPLFPLATVRLLEVS